VQGSAREEPVHQLGLAVRPGLVEHALEVGARRGLGAAASRSELGERVALRERGLGAEKNVAEKAAEKGSDRKAGRRREGARMRATAGINVRLPRVPIGIGARVSYTSVFPEKTLVAATDNTDSTWRAEGGGASYWSFELQVMFYPFD
jgi:hypothetical protein